MTEETALVPTRKGNLGFLNPQNIGEALEAAKVISDSSLVPVSFKGKPADILVAMQMGYELGVSPMQAIQNIAVVNGRPSVWGDLALALASNHPSVKQIVETHSGDWSKGDFSATCVLHYHEKLGLEPVSRTFTQSAAKKAGLATKGGVWQNYPERMCQMRARSWAIRDSKAVEALRGLSTVEEAQDIATPMQPVQQATGTRTRQSAGATSDNQEVKVTVLKPEAPVEAPLEPENGETETPKKRGRPSKKSMESTQKSEPIQTEATPSSESSDTGSETGVMFDTEGTSHCQSCGVIIPADVAEMSGGLCSACADARDTQNQAAPATATAPDTGANEFHNGMCKLLSANGINPADAMGKLLNVKSFKEVPAQDRKLIAGKVANFIVELKGTIKGV